MLRKIFSLAVILIIVLAASISHAVSTLSLVSAGDSAYQLEGTGMEGAAGFDITVYYDPAVLAAPKVAQGALLSGAMLAVNPNAPGVVRISAVTLSPVNGSGQLLTLAFTRTSGGAGIRSLAARLIDLSGKPLPSQVRVAVAPGTSGGSSAPDSVTSRETPRESDSPAAGTAPGTIIGILPLPATGLPAKEDRDREPAPEPEPARPEPAPEPVVSTAKAFNGPEMKSKTVYTQPSILERFRDFRDKRTMKACVKLFEQEQLIGFRQEPAVVLADGRAKATVRFISTPERERTTDLALMGAKLAGSRRDPESSNTWIVTILPEKGSDRVTLSVPQKDLLMVCPLTVAPKAEIDLDRSGAVNEADFGLFLKKRGTPEKPLFDLNNDGKRDYIDDYIFTANYIARGRR